jgi:hypothetical protein
MIDTDVDLDMDIPEPAARKPTWAASSGSHGLRDNLITAPASVIYRWGEDIAEGSVKNRP